MLATSQLDINLSAIEFNLASLRARLQPSTRICGVVKADAYGLGAAVIARRLAANACVSMLAVYSLDQALEISAVIPPATPILILAPLRSPEHINFLSDMLRARPRSIHLVLHDLEQLRALATHRLAETSNWQLHLEVDTGMARGGCRPEHAAEVLRELALHAHHFTLHGIFTHLACPGSDDARSLEQLARFDRFCSEHAHLIPPGCIRHTASTRALSLGRRAHADMVRIGQGWCGYGFKLADTPALKPAVRWHSTLAAIKWIDAGDTVGYGCRHTASARTCVGLVPVGYADGWPGSLTTSRVGSGARGESVLVRCREVGKRDGPLFPAPVIGAVSMDQITIDLTNLPEAVMQVGAEVELIASDIDAPNHLPLLAKQAGIVTHELLCRISPRVPRRHLIDAHLGAPIRTSAEEMHVASRVSLQPNSEKAQVQLEPLRATSE